MRPAVNQVGKGNRDKQRRFCPAVWCEMSALLSRRFLEVERPRLSKVSRTLAFVYPYLFDSIPLFYRVGRALLRAAFPAPAPLLAPGLERSAASSCSENAQENSSTFIYLKKKKGKTNSCRKRDLVIFSCAGQSAAFFEGCESPGQQHGVGGDRRHRAGGG